MWFEIFGLFGLLAAFSSMDKMNNQAVLLILALILGGVAGYFISPLFLAFISIVLACVLMSDYLQNNHEHISTWVFAAVVMWVTCYFAGGYTWFGEFARAYILR